ncbi:Uncharacterised protein [Slackia heliotrinireducens]|uniref:SHOCT domain-containing protein n=1 Tax=Slackia heliotrinireducens (strain ATCC 29202 / DSM 20476 / NCTC 11029 / RHS 1) TaxID=471855 RepID=C7N675_SLAHD|nr:hypothetical protein [Slackia heliotrinireducens]ACV22410.1 hypothetical protein Shel_13890 [Slackia heliotrinireducens DSM 20476]VEH00735.1 Uncharacterised protein [Slackia heliotrinireducens]
MTVIATPTQNQTIDPRIRSAARIAGVMGILALACSALGILGQVLLGYLYGWASEVAPIVVNPYNIILTIGMLVLIVGSFMCNRPVVAVGAGVCAVILALSVFQLISLTSMTWVPVYVYFGAVGNIIAAFAFIGIVVLSFIGVRSSHGVLRGFVMVFAVLACLVQVAYALSTFVSMVASGTDAAMGAMNFLCVGLPNMLNSLFVTLLLCLSAKWLTAIPGEGAASSHSAPVGGIASVQSAGSDTTAADVLELNRLHQNGLLTDQELAQALRALSGNS